MLEAQRPDPPAPIGAARRRRALLVTTMFEPAGAAAQLGRDAYSYHRVYRALRPLLERIGPVVEVDRPESRLNYAVRRARQDGLDPVHLSFLPLQRVYVGSLSANVAFPFWEFPHLPDEDFDANPRNNWVRIANRLSSIVCASEFTRAAFLRAGVRVPVEVAPVPVDDAYFGVPAWRPGEQGRLDCPAHAFSDDDGPAAPVDPWTPASRLARTAAWARGVYDQRIQARVPQWFDRMKGAGVRVARTYYEAHRSLAVPAPNVARLTLDGIVYTCFVNPFDPRKNWNDLLSAFLIALRGAADATLVLKLVVSPSLAAAGLRGMVECYQRLGLRHRCRLVFVTDYLSDAQLLELTRCSTYGLSATHAEGACLPLQDFLAAARPAVAPAHTALADYIDPEVGFVIDSHPEPTHWPHDPSQRLKTTWHRLVWQSLHDQILASYRVAKEAPDQYARLAERGRARMRALAGAEPVWARLRRALDPLDDAAALR